MIEFVPAVGVKQSVGSHNVCAFLWHMAEQTLDECLRVQTKCALSVFLGVCIGNAAPLPVVPHYPFLRDRSPPKVAAHIFVHPLGMLVSRLYFRVPLHPPKFVEQIETLLHPHPRTRIQHLLSG